ncbi:MAG: thioredoxin domain-containing protein [Acidobacteriota bacterium]|nr:thioredoxin domain-containing protein [Acidobacteriota bacterium]
MKEENRKTVSRLGLLVAVFGVVLLGLWAFSEGDLAAEEALKGADDKVLATVGDHTVTRREVEEKIASGLRELEQKRYEMLQQGLDLIVREKMVELAAAEMGMLPEALVEQEVQAKIAPVTDGQVDEFYEARKSQIQQPKTEVAGQIRDYLEQQQGVEAYATFVDGLRGKYKVETFLDPLRVEVASTGPAKGPEDAPVTIVEFSDFECPYCSRVVPTLDKVSDTYGDKVRIVFRQFPLSSIHANAQKAAEASLCANEQGKFWEMHDSMFASQRALGVEALKNKATELDMEPDRFNDCLDSSRYAEQVAGDLEAGQAAGVSGTPALFVNGRFLNGAQPYESVAQVIDDELRRAGL